MTIIANSNYWGHQSSPFREACPQRRGSRGPLGGLAVISRSHRFVAIAFGAGDYLIPRFSDQNAYAQSRRPIDMIFQGCSTSLFQA